MKGNTQIHFLGLGNRNPVEEREQIIWWLEQRAKQIKNKSHLTRYWLDLRQKYVPALERMEAYEVSEFIKSKTTETQVKNSIEGRAKTALLSDVKMQLELANFKAEQKMLKDKWKTRHQLLNFFNLN